MNVASLPPEMFDDRPHRTIEDLAPGESGHVLFTEMCVNSARECFLITKTELQPEDNFEMIAVRRDETGFHVTVPSDITYQPREPFRGASYHPVASLTMGPPTIAKWLKSRA